MSAPVDYPTLSGSQNIVLRPLRADEVERVAEIQAEPGVARWWGLPDKAELRRQAEGGSDEKALAIEREGEIVGLIQYHEENEPDFRHAGIDVFLAGRAQGHGLGTNAVRTLARYLIDERDITGSRSTRRPTTPRRSGSTRRLAFVRSGSCASTGVHPMEPGGTDCSWPCSHAS